MKRSTATQRGLLKRLFTYGTTQTRRSKPIRKQINIRAGKRGGRNHRLNTDVAVLNAEKIGMVLF